MDCPLIDLKRARTYIIEQPNKEARCETTYLMASMLPRELLRKILQEAGLAVYSFMNSCWENKNCFKKDSFLKKYLYGLEVIKQVWPKLPSQAEYNNFLCNYDCPRSQMAMLRIKVCAVLGQTDIAFRLIDQLETSSNAKIPFRSD